MDDDDDDDDDDADNIDMLLQITVSCCCPMCHPHVSSRFYRRALAGVKPLASLEHLPERKPATLLDPAHTWAIQRHVQSWKKTTNPAFEYWKLGEQDSKIQTL